MPRGGEIFAGTGGGVARAQQRRRADQDEKRQGYRECGAHGDDPFMNFGMTWSPIRL